MGRGRRRSAAPTASAWRWWCGGPCIGGHCDHKWGGKCGRPPGRWPLWPEEAAAAASRACSSAVVVGGPVGADVVRGEVMVVGDDGELLMCMGCCWCCEAAAATAAAVAAAPHSCSCSRLSMVACDIAGWYNWLLLSMSISEYSRRGDLRKCCSMNKPSIGSLQQKENKV